MLPQFSPVKNIDDISERLTASPMSYAPAQVRREREPKANEATSNITKAPTP